MAYDVILDDRPYRIRHPAGVAALGLATLGLYSLYWYYRANDDARMYLRDYSIRPLIATLAVLSAMLLAPVAIAAVIWARAPLRVTAVLAFLLALAVMWRSFLHTARRIRRVQERAGVATRASVTTGFALLALMPIVGYAYAQAALNAAWTSPTADHTPQPAGPASTAAPSAHAEPRPVGHNRVTPADLGQRVTFQFELPNGFTTEAVGVFERWDAAAQTFFVRKKDGTEVRVPARGVRHGKVIPPRPAAPVQ
ncbi:MAG: DUF4234 domain-containing protein [Actinomycetota bacterium]